MSRSQRKRGTRVFIQIQQLIGKLIQREPDFAKSIGQPFEHAQQLASLRRRQQEINEHFDRTANPNPPNQPATPGTDPAVSGLVDNSSAAGPPSTQPAGPARPPNVANTIERARRNLAALDARAPAYAGLHL